MKAEHKCLYMILGSISIEKQLKIVLHSSYEYRDHINHIGMIKLVWLTDKTFITFKYYNLITLC